MTTERLRRIDAPPKEQLSVAINDGLEFWDLWLGDPDADFQKSREKAAAGARQTVVRHLPPGLQTRENIDCIIEGTRWLVLDARREDFSSEEVFNRAVYELSAMPARVQPIRDELAARPKGFYDSVFRLAQLAAIGSIQV